MLSTSPGKFGAYCASVLTTVSPNSFRRESQFPSLNLNGVNCTHTDITCFASGAIDGSRTVGIVTSRYGSGAIDGSRTVGIVTSRYGAFTSSPYFDASYARSR